MLNKMENKRVKNNRRYEYLTPKLFTLFKQGISKKQLKKDILAGFVVGIVALPLAIAFAIASGVSPEKGLITAIFGGFIISFLGGSRVQIGGPTGAFIIIVYGIIEKYGVDGLTLSTFMAGLILLFAGLFKIGDLIKYISHSLIVGFTSGIALIIFSTQIKDFLGLSIKKVPSEFLDKWISYAENIASINYYSLFISFTSIIIILYFSKITKFIKILKPLSFIPTPLIAIVFCTFIVNFFNLPIDTIGTKFTQISGTIPMPKLPTVTFELIKSLIAPAFTIALLGGIESLLSASVADSMIGAKHRPNIELVAQGFANMVSAIFGGIPATGAIARTATNVKNGATTPISGLVHSIILLIIMVFAFPLAKLIPLSCLAGILMVVSYNMSEIHQFIDVFNSNKNDRAVLLTVFLITIIFDLIIAIEIGILLSFFLFIKKMSFSAHINVIDKKDFILLELSGAFFFASSSILNKKLSEINTESNVIIFSFKRVPIIDVTAIYELKKEIYNFNKLGKKVFITEFNKNIEIELIKMKINFIAIMKEDITEIISSLKENDEKNLIKVQNYFEDKNKVSNG